MTFKELVMNNEFKSLVPQLISIDERCKEALESLSILSILSEEWKKSLTVRQ